MTKVTLEYPDGSTHSFYLEPCNVQQTRDLVPTDRDEFGKVLGWQENPANPGVTVHITGTLAKKGE